MGKENTGIEIVIGGSCYSLSLGGTPGYSLAGSGKGYGLAGRLESSRIGYSSMVAGGYSAGMKMKGYSLRQAYPVNLLPAPYRKFSDTFNEMLKMYKKKCPHCGKESISSNYNFN